MNDGEKNRCDRLNRDCTENGCCGKKESTACGGCPGATANGCGGCCPHTAGTEFRWDYDDTVLVYSSDMLEELP